GLASAGFVVVAVVTGDAEGLSPAVGGGGTAVLASSLLPDPPPAMVSIQEPGFDASKEEQAPSNAATDATANARGNRRSILNSPIGGTPWGGGVCSNRGGNSRASCGRRLAPPYLRRLSLLQSSKLRDSGQ